MDTGGAGVLRDTRFLVGGGGEASGKGMSGETRIFIC